MTCTVTFYALQPDGGEIVLTVHRVERGALMAYTGTPGIALATVRTVKSDPKADGFRVVDAAGHVLLDYRDPAGRAAMPPR